MGMHGKGHSTLGHGMTTVLLGCILVVGDLCMQHTCLLSPVFPFACENNGFHDSSL